MTTRRGFLAGILSAGFAPAVVGSSILMPVKTIIQPRRAKLGVIETLTIYRGTGHLPYYESLNIALQESNLFHETSHRVYGT